MKKIYLAVLDLSRGLADFQSLVAEHKSLVAACDLVRWPGIEPSYLHWEHGVLAWTNRKVPELFKDRGWVLLLFASSSPTNPT